MSKISRSRVSTGGSSYGAGEGGNDGEDGGGDGGRGLLEFSSSLDSLDSRRLAGVSGTEYGLGRVLVLCTRVGLGAVLAL